MMRLRLELIFPFVACVGRSGVFGRWWGGVEVESCELLGLNLGVLARG